MATEEKKYLVNVESNLDKYAKDAAKAAEEVDKLTIENIRLKGSTTASKEEIEKSDAALRSSQKEYREAKKLVDLQTQANNSNINSRKQLGEIVTLEQRRLGSLANTYTINEKGVRELSKAYIEQVKRLSEAKQAIIEYDKAQGDGRTSVGLYSEAIAGAGTNLLAMVSPMALVAAGVAAAKKLFDGLTEAIMSTTFAMDLMNIAGAVTKQIFFDIALNGGIHLQNLKAVIGATKEFNSLRVQQYEVDYKLGKIQREINALMLEASDVTKSDAERLAIYTKVRELDTEQTVKETDAIKKRILATNEMLKVRVGDEELLKELYGLAGQLDAAYAKSDQAMRRVASQMSGIQKRTNQERQAEHEAWLKAKADELKVLEERAKKDAIALQALKDKNTKEIEELQKLVKNDLLNSESRKQIKLDELKFNQEIQDQIKLDLENQMKFDAFVTEQWIRNRDMAANALGELSNIIGQQTTAGKVFAIAQATINTWTAATMTLRDPTIPSTFLRVLTMATVILSGLNAVRNIMKVDTSGKGTPSISAPTAITATAQRSFATPVSSSFFTQPQLTQQQLNVAPQNLLTAADIADAIRRLPAPIVTVEDINARTESKRKVDVRSII